MYHITTFFIDILCFLQFFLAIMYDNSKSTKVVCYNQHLLQSSFNDATRFYLLVQSLLIFFNTTKPASLCSCISRFPQSHRPLNTLNAVMQMILSDLPSQSDVIFGTTHARDKIHGTTQNRNKTMSQHFPLHLHYCYGQTNQTRSYIFSKVLSKPLELWGFTCLKK